METVALHTRLRPGAETEYESIHQVIPAELDARLREVGVHEWRIWRSGQDLFHLVTCVDYQAMRRALQDDPVNVGWQERLAPLLKVADDYSGSDHGLDQVWSLPPERP